MSRIPQVIFLAIVACTIANIGWAQQGELTRIRGVITDTDSGEPLPYVNISFLGTSIGTVSNIDGQFYLESYQATDSLKISYIGYNTTNRKVTIGTTQKMDIRMIPVQVQLDGVEISDKRLRYRNKDNPAVDVIKQVIAHKDRNHPKSHDFMEYEKYEKVEFDLNNITEEFKNKRFLKEFQLIFDYIDTSEVNGKPYLPIFLRETSSKVYYRQKPHREVEHKLAEKMTGFEEYYDNKGISSFLDKMYQDIDIYGNEVNILTQKFISPISILGPTIYKYYIADTIEINQEKLFKLAFRPRNENDLAFVGNMLVTTDSSYAVKHINLRIAESINLNFVNDLYVEQSFERNADSTYSLSIDKINIDFQMINPDGLGMFGKRTVSYRNLIFDQEREAEIYKGLDKQIISDSAYSRNESYWQEARHLGLSKSEEGVFNMVEEVKELPAFKRMMDIFTFAFVGYVEFEKIEIGPFNSFYSWNEVEGDRFRFGGRTRPGFSERIMLEAYGAYGSLDRQWKYLGGITHFWSQNPRHYLRYRYQSDVRNPGESFLYVTEDNFLLSLKRGVNDKRIYFQKHDLDYQLDVRNGVSFTIGLKQESLQPGGILSFAAGPQNRTEFTTALERKNEEINTLESSFTLRFAPNEQFYHGKVTRTPIPNKHPIITLNYTHGFDKVFDTPFEYDKLSLSVSKRNYMPPFGYLDTELLGTKTFGQVPYPLLDIPLANQTYSYQSNSYNLMNFLEFVSDEAVSVNLEHNFNGFIMNQIPLIKKLKWRSIVTFKGMTGRLTSVNDPSAPGNEVLPQLPLHDDGTQATYPLSTYMESSIGIGNILKFARVDFVKRWTQLNHPQVNDAIAVRVKFKIEF